MKFNLRQKLSLVFGSLLLISAFIGIQSIQRFSYLGQSIDVILRENYRSVIACQQMKEALERIDSGILFVLLGNDKDGRQMIEKNISGFKKAMEVEINNLTLPEEPAKASHLKSLFSQYNEKLSGIMVKPDGEKIRENYFSALFPLFQKIKMTADGILQMNQQNMMKANNRARIRSADARRDMILFLIISSFMAFIFILFSNRWILKPIQRLIQSTTDIKNGNLNLVLKVESHDEIGQLSEAFNTMLESLRFFRRSDQSKVLRIQRSTQEVFKNLPTAIAIVNSQGKIEIATESARIYFGLAPGSNISEPHLAWLSNFYRDIKNGKNITDTEYHSEIKQHFINYQERFFQPKAFPILDRDNELNRWIIILEDVTLEKQSDEIKKNLLSTVSHQLKTPLTAIRMAIHLLLEEKIGVLNEKQNDLLVSAHEECERLYGIIENILNISRIESGKIKMKVESVSPYDLVAEALASFQREAQDKGITLESNLPQGLPDVRADHNQIGQVIGNLLSNAIKYSPYGSKVLVFARQENEKVRFCISDKGRGIPEKFKDRIFEKFFRIPGQVADEGEGLGLAIAREIIKAHDGDISFTSSKKKGTTFEFLLPIMAGLSPKEVSLD